MCVCLGLVIFGAGGGGGVFSYGKGYIHRKVDSVVSGKKGDIGDGEEKGDRESCGGKGYYLIRGIM